MSKTETVVRLDERVLREAERVALARHKTLDQYVEDVLRRDVDTDRASGRLGNTLPVQLRTHGEGGLLPGVNLEDLEAIDQLLNES